MLTPEELIRTINDLKLKISTLKVGAILIVSTGLGGAVDIQYCSNLSADDQRKVLRHFLQLLEKS